MSSGKCPYCQRPNSLYIAKCRKCGVMFCDRCQEAAATLADKVEIKTASVTAYASMCPACGETDIEYNPE